MKKMLLVSLMVVGIGSMAMAKGGKEGRGQMNRNPEMKKVMKDMRDSKEFKEARIQIEELNLANKKEMIKDNPNFDLIGQNNLKAAQIKAELKTDMMEAKFNANKAK